MELGATLYIQNSSEAVDFYQKAFGMTIGYHEFYEDGTYLHAELMKNGQSIFAVSEFSDEGIDKAMLNAKMPTMSMGIDFDSEAELKTAYAALIENGHILRPIGPLPWSSCSADVVDKFGVCWYIYIP